MTKVQLGLLIGLFLGALAMFVTLGIIRLYLEERQERTRGRNRSSLKPEAGSSIFSDPLAKSCLASAPYPPMVIKVAGEKEERPIFLLVFIE